MILELFYKWLQKQNEIHIYSMRTDDISSLMINEMSFYVKDNIPIDVKIEDRVYLLDGLNRKRYGSLIVKDVIVKKKQYGSKIVDIKYAIFVHNILLCIPAACRNDRALIVRTSDTVVMLRKIINYILNGENT